MSPDKFGAIVTRSKLMHDLFSDVEAMASSPKPVLITGETGTGKELLARSVHTVSRGKKRLVAVNVAGLDDTMFSDTLFGHARGAFTDAREARGGLITHAADGTLFLDEIGDLSIPSQVKLLRLLEDGTYYPLGTDNPREIRARVIVATNADILRRVDDGTFRRDLYYRLKTHHLHLPPLRERKEDLPLLVDHFLEKAARVLKKPAPAPPVELYRLLEKYAFPGNVRELDSMIFGAVTRHQEQNAVLSLETFRATVYDPSNSPQASAALADWLASCPDDALPTLKEAEQALIAETLRRKEGNQTAAAGLLGLTREALNKRLSRQKGTKKSKRDNSSYGVNHRRNGDKPGE